MRGYPIRATFKGELLTIAEIAKATGFSPATIKYRMETGVPFDAPRRPPSAKMLHLEFRGRIATVTEIRAETGLSDEQIYKRHDGKMFYELPPRAPPKLLTFNGITDTTGGWAKRIGITQSALLKRIQSGWPIERVLRPGLEKRPYTVTIGDKTYTIGQLAKRTGLDKALLYTRIVVQCWPVVRALTEQPIKTSERHAKTRALKRMIASFNAPSAADVSPALASPSALPAASAAPPPAPSTTFDPLAATGSRPQKTHLAGIS